jgi:hypothetical protein
MNGGKFWLVQSDADGRTIGLVPIPDDRVTPVEDGFVIEDYPSEEQP